MSVVEIVLGFLLAALAVEPMITTLNEAGIITFTGGYHRPTVRRPRSWLTKPPSWPRA